MVCEQETRYVLVQGNSTQFAGGHFLVDYLETDLDLTSYFASCSVPKAYLTKEVPLSYDSELQKWFILIDFTAEETLKMPLGDTSFYITVYDENKEPCSLKKFR